MIFTSLFVWRILFIFSTLFFLVICYFLVFFFWFSRDSNFCSAASRISSGTLKGKRNFKTLRSDRFAHFLLSITALAFISFKDFTRNVLSEITELTHFCLGPLQPGDERNQSLLDFYGITTLCKFLSYHQELFSNFSNKIISSIFCI
ncbi:MAG: hypothetical protein CM15mP102_21990 [Flavobacteriales bacterium]|nr:MAG: hypothetical protein CM15mP102_21990 [Flavobacteriales bacterium]